MFGADSLHNVAAFFTVKASRRIRLLHVQVKGLLQVAIIVTLKLFQVMFIKIQAYSQ